MSNDKPKKNKRTVKVTFIDRDGDEITVDAKIGDTLLEVAKEYDVDLEGISFSLYCIRYNNIVLILLPFPPSSSISLSSPPLPSLSQVHAREPYHVPHVI
jgi:hypothetical protein